MPKIKVKPVEQISRKPVSYAFAAFMRHCQLKNLSCSSSAPEKRGSARMPLSRFAGVPSVIVEGPGGKVKGNKINSDRRDFMLTPPKEFLYIRVK